MKIIIVGDGKVGYTIAQQLAKEKHDITIIDKNEEALRRADETLDVMCIKGNGARASVLLEANVSQTDLVIAATSRDETNMICCLTAKKLGVSHTVARIRDPEFYEDCIMLRTEMGIDMVINPELTTAREIANILQFPSAMNVEHFMNGMVRMVDLRLDKSDEIVGKTLAKTGHLLPKNILVIAVERDGAVYIPSGDFRFESEDQIFVVGQISGLNTLFKQLNRYEQKINSVMIVGGSRIAYYLATIANKIGMKTMIIEIEGKKAKDLADRLDNTLVIQADGTSFELLESENLHDFDAFVTLTDRDEENLITAMYAVEKKVKKVIAKTNRVGLPSIIRKLGIDSVISPKDITANYILAYVRGMENSQGSIVETLFKIVNGKAEVISFVANETTRFINTSLKNVKLKENVLIAAIGHKDQIIFPHGNEVIKLGDKVLIVSKNNHIINDLNDVLA